MILLEACRIALENSNLRAFLHVIREGETNQTDDAYRLAYGGVLYPPNVHPWLGRTTTEVGHSTAFGAYQYLGTSAKEALDNLGLGEDFSPASQDLCAAWTIMFKRKALDAIKAGDLVKACSLLADEWVSLPHLGLQRVQRVFLQYGGTYAASEALQAEPTPQPTLPPVDAPVEPVKESRMPIFLSALLQLIPGLITVFGKDSERAKENAATFNVVAEQVVKAVPGATDLPTAISAMVADPAVKAKAEAEVMSAPSILALIEVGGGIVEARKRDDAAINAPNWYRPLLTPAFVISILMLGFVGVVLFNVVTDAGNLWRPEDRSQVLMLAVAIVSAVLGYYLGSSLGSAKKDDALIAR